MQFKIQKKFNLVKKGNVPRIVIFLISFLISTSTNSQFKVDAGKDTTYCVSAWFKPMILGADVRVENGTPPYTFAWEYYQKISDKFIITASNYLNDTTLQSPLIDNYLSWPEWRKFILHVTDANGNYAKDSIFIRLSLFSYLTGGGQTIFYIEKGDSILLNFNNSGIFGGISPLTYHWSPKTYLSEPDSVITWSKPDSSIQYEVVAIDSCGCVSESVMVYDIRVLPDTIENKPEFAPIGAEWYYNYDPDVTLDDGYQKITVLRDTIIDNQSCRFLQIRNIGYSYFYKNYYDYQAGNIILYEKDNIVYYYKNKQFYVLYDFAAKEGDSYNSISYMPNCSQTYKVTIDSVTFVEVDEQLLKNFHVTLNDSFQTNYIEKIGYNVYLLPQFGLGCEILTGPHYPGPLRCYYDSDIGIYSTNIVSNCDYITSSIENKIFNDLMVFPNPADSYITISNPSNIKIKKIELFDFAGRVVQMWDATEYAENTMNIQNISPGVYLLKAETDAGVKTEKLVIQ